MTGSPRVLIADAHVLTRRGLRIALESEGFTVVGEVGSVHDALQAALAERPDACLIDMHIPGEGVAAAETISARLPETVVLMLTTSADANELVGAIRAGASGYLPKTMNARRLSAALHSALSGEPAIPRALVAWLLDEIRAGGARRPECLLPDGRRVVLTPREGQVLDLILDELTTREIATRLGISRVTVRRHVSELLHKLDAPDRTTAAALIGAGRSRGIPR
jgi:DNA-binding NarL/FixJ family response regulator